MTTRIPRPALRPAQAHGADGPGHMVHGAVSAESMDLNDWMNRFGTVEEWIEGPTHQALEAYPHFYVDLLAAWECKRQIGAREVLVELRRRMRRATGWIVREWWDSCGFYDYPPGVTALRVDDTWEMRAGYERRGEEGLFDVDGQMATSILWHRHDGYGDEAGTIQVYAEFVPNDMEVQDA